MERRTFLKATAAAGALASVISVKPILGNLVESKAIANEIKEEKWVNSFCTNCVGWCPIRVKVVNGKAVHVEGNPNSQTTGGKVCPKGHLSLQQLYDPDRIKGPMKRTNPEKGRNIDPQFVPISWEEALDTVAEKMKELRDKGEPHKMVLNRGRYNTLDVHILYDRFCKVYGTPNNISHSSICAETTKLGRDMADGVWDYVGIDLEKTNYILCFGLSPLEAHRPYTRLLNVFGKIRDRANRAKMVVVDPRMSVSAAKADEWVALNPGTDGAFANAISHVILTEGLWDKKFVGDFADADNGFTAGQTITETSGVNEEGEPIPTFIENETSGLTKWWNMVLKDTTPEWAEEITGIPAERIVKIAREFATVKPAYAWHGRGTGMRPNGAYCTFSVYVLNGLVGSIDVPGGIIYPSGSTYAADPLNDSEVMDDIATEGRKQPRIDQRRSKKYPNAGVVTAQLAESILNEDPYNVEMVFAYFNNFTFSVPNTKTYEEAMSKVPFTVHVSPMMTEFTHFADIVLPTPTNLEKWNYSHPVKSGLYAETRLAMPAVDPLYDTKQTTEITLELAKRIGGSVAKTFEGITIDGYIKARLGEMQSWDKWMETGIHTKAPYKIGSTREKGFNTPTKKFEFFSNKYKELLETRGISDTSDADMAPLKIDARGDLVYLPHWESTKDLGEKSEYPLLLISYKSALAGEGRTGNNPWAQDRYLVQYAAGNTTFAEINPDTAAKWGIKDGDKVKVSSLFGEVQCPAKLSEGIHPDILAMVFGQGHWSYGRFAKDIGVNPNDLTGTDYEYISGSSSFYNTRVKVAKV